LKVSETFVVKFSQEESIIQEKSGRIIKSVGKSVSFVTISSICLVTHSIRKSGNGQTLFILNWMTSEKFPLARVSVLISRERLISFAPHHSRFINEFCQKLLEEELFCLATVENISFILCSKVLDLIHVFL